MAELKEYEKSLANQNKALQQELDAKIQKLEDMEQKTRTGMSEQSRALQEQIVENVKEYEKNLGNQNKAFQEQLLGKILKGAELPAHMPEVKRSLALIYAVNPFGADHQSHEHDPSYTKQTIKK